MVSVETEPIRPDLQRAFKLQAGIDFQESRAPLVSTHRYRRRARTVRRRKLDFRPCPEEQAVEIRGSAVSYRQNSLDLMGEINPSLGAGDGPEKQQG
jgi:hypothetical protein